MTRIKEMGRTLDPSCRHSIHLLRQLLIALNKTVLTQADA